MNEEKNVQLTKGAYAAFKRGDIAGLLNTLADDVGWFLPGPKDIIPVLGQRRGRQQVAEFFSKLAELQESEQFEPREFIAQGDTVVVLGHYRWRVKSTKRVFESDWAHVFTIRNGKITNFHEYFDTDAAVAAYRAAQTAAGR